MWPAIENYNPKSFIGAVCMHVVLLYWHLATEKQFSDPLC